MAITRTTDLSNSVVVKYRADYLMQAYGEEVWGQFVDWTPMNEGASGSTFDFPGIAEMEPDLTELDEESDVVPTRLVDDQLVVTPKMYGRAFVVSEEARFRSRIDIREAGAKVLAQNRTRVSDRLIRNAVLGAANVYRVGGLALRTDLDASADKVTYAYLRELHALAAMSDIEPWGADNVFMAPISPLLASDIQSLTEYKEIQYRRPVNLQGKEIMGGMQPFIFAGFHFVPHKWGKVYMSGGTAAQAATDLNGAVAVGATTVIVTDATGIIVGDYITIGTLEATKAETVRVTVVATNTLTVVGSGNKASSLGLKYAHADGEAVTEGAFAAALPVIGRNSIKGIHGSNTGRYGTAMVKPGTLDILERFIYHGWKNHLGVSVWPRYVIRGEVAVGTKAPMAE